MHLTKGRNSRQQLVSVLLFGTILGGLSSPANSQAETTTSVAEEIAPPAATAPASPLADDAVIRTIEVQGSQRIEPGTVLSYIELQPGQIYTHEALDEALRDLFETELFADVEIRDNQGDLTIVVQENPVINRILLEGNRRIKDEDLRGEIRLAPRQIFTRSRTRADVARIIELYRRRGRFAASVEPQMVTLDQNRVDIVFEINEGPRSNVRQINVIGNEVFSDGQLRSEMATKQ